jgi:hypothetical protein
LQNSDSARNKKSDCNNAVFVLKKRGKGKAVPLQACSGPEGSRKLRFPDYMTTAQDGGKVGVAQRVPAS